MERDYQMGPLVPAAQIMSNVKQLSAQITNQFHKVKKDGYAFSIWNDCLRCSGQGTNWLEKSVPPSIERDTWEFSFFERIFSLKAGQKYTLNGLKHSANNMAIPLVWLAHLYG